MLQNMQKKVEAEGEKEAELFESTCATARQAVETSQRAFLMPATRFLSWNPTSRRVRQRRSSWTRTSSSTKLTVLQQRQPWRKLQHFARRNLQPTQKSPVRTLPTLLHAAK